MSKYFDKLLKLNESLGKELKDKGLVKEDEDETQVPVPADSLTDDQKKGILSDTLNDAGLKVDDKVVDELVKNPDEMAGVQKILGDEQKKNESAEELGDISEEVVIRMDDDDLDMHGYVSTRGGKELVLTDNIDEAQRFQHEELGQNRIEAICNKFHYDPETFSTKSLDPRADEPYDEGLDLYSDDEDTFKDIEPKKRVSIPKARPLTADDEPLDLYSPDEDTFKDYENWVSLDPMHPGATTLP